MGYMKCIPYKVMHFVEMMEISTIDTPYFRFFINDIVMIDFGIFVMPNAGNVLFVLLR